MSSRDAVGNLPGFLAESSRRADGVPPCAEFPIHWSVLAGKLITGKRLSCWSLEELPESAQKVSYAHPRGTGHRL